MNMQENGTSEMLQPAAVSSRRVITSTQSAWDAPGMIRKGNYGIVVVTEGQFEGRVGYYDDDEGTDAIVYFGRPFETDYEMIKRKYLVQADPKLYHLPLEKYLSDFPELCELLGIKK